MSRKIPGAGSHQATRRTILKSAAAVAAPFSSEALEARIARDLPLWRDVAKRVGIKPIEPRLLRSPDERSDIRVTNWRMPG
jgi:hypothetical protein